MDLSILIPSRNEEFLKNTIEDVLVNSELNTEVITVLDGAWANPPITDHDRVNLIYVNDPIGQRASTNLACKLSRAKYVMKVDAHCSFDKGFDRKMIEGFEKMGDENVMVPIMRNLWAFDWKCKKCGKKTYQGPTPTECQEKNYKGTGLPCDGKIFIKKMMWVGKHNPQSWSYCFDSEPHFQYFEEYKHRPSTKEQRKTGFTETMSLQGSCFMATRENYWKYELCDESLGNWGNQGIEVALATWYNGGQVLVNHNTWYAHMFRTQGGDFSFPWENHGKDTRQTKRNVVDKYWGNPKLVELLERFWPVNGWTDEDLAKLKNI
jgi:glycosyltransferase involved in cell wall biosynthesis